MLVQWSPIFRGNEETRTQMRIGGDEPGTQEHTLDLDRQQVDLAITRHLMLTDLRTRRSQPHHRLDFPVSKASTMRLRHQLYHVLHLARCPTMHRNALSLTTHQLNLCQVLAIGSV